MVRRLKEDIRAIQGGFPERQVTPVVIDGLPEDAPELQLSRLVDGYRSLREERFAATSRGAQAAAGADRAALAFLVDAYEVEEVEGRERTVLRLHPRLAPVKVSVLPLVSKEGMPEKAKEIMNGFRKAGIQAEYDAGGSIGKRYRRQDEIGTPWGITVDHQTMEDDTVTLRDRDSLEQVRVPVEGLPGQIAARLATGWRSPKLV